MVVPSIVGAGASDVVVYWDGIPSDSSLLSVRVDDDPWMGNKIGLVVGGSYLLCCCSTLQFCFQNKHIKGESVALFEMPVSEENSMHTITLSNGNESATVNFRTTSDPFIGSVSVFR